MSEQDPPRRPRFPLKLAETAPVQRRLVTPPHDKPRATAAPTQRVAPPALAAAVLRPAAPATQQTVALPPGLAARCTQWQAQGLPGARLLERLIADGCHDEAVLEAFARIPRHAFVDPALLSQAYEDTALPIGLGQTISKPTVVARMLALLRARPGGPQLGRVLEIGTGCGYQAALLALLARQVYSVERLQGLFDKAREKLAPIRADNLRLILGDGRLGHGPNAPYDAIIAAAGGRELPSAWLDQLAPGGRLVAPSHDETRGAQVLWVVDRLVDGSFRRVAHETVRFVPLESGIDMRRL
jgi:protein-L-isoaspartate(D-aspartate) O-methyltransferase